MYIYVYICIYMYIYADISSEQVGATNLKDLPKRTTFIRVTQQLNNVFTGQEVK